MQNEDIRTCHPLTICNILGKQKTQHLELCCFVLLMRHTLFMKEIYFFLFHSDLTVEKLSGSGKISLFQRRNSQEANTSLKKTMFSFCILIYFRKTKFNDKKCISLNSKFCQSDFCIMATFPPFVILLDIYSHQNWTFNNKNIHPQEGNQLKINQTLIIS